MAPKSGRQAVCYKYDCQIAQKRLLISFLTQQTSLRQMGLNWYKCLLHMYWPSGAPGLPRGLVEQCAKGETNEGDLLDIKCCFLIAAHRKIKRHILQKCEETVCVFQYTFHIVYYYIIIIIIQKKKKRYEEHDFTCELVDLNSVFNA